ncbi:hypothetical protein [Pseudomonas sp. RGM2987]|uniref:DUF6124 family protein n=1 Tax=Pseudomonas sp. RGM2987 TaxID=2930090 RepID=UPI001FD70A18|nr:hypothetical protein [Pseudomonas sp. RGM2987]MCJ8204402.1 hypothetical protein [Pseudomonas sp. RGM2987]
MIKVTPNPPETDPTSASADAMLNDLTFDPDGSRRRIALGVQQMIELSELLANKALDIADPR